MLIGKNLPKFRIYYGDGSTWSGNPWYAPQQGVQVIAIALDNEKGFGFVYGKSISEGYYCYRDGTWFCHDNSGYEDYMRNMQGPKKVIYGRTMSSTKVFNQILERAIKEGLG